MNSHLDHSFVGWGLSVKELSSEQREYMESKPGGLKRSWG